MDILTDRVSEIRCAKCQKAVDVSALPAFSEVTCPHCLTRQPVPARLNGFLLLSRIGKGGMGTVYQAVDESLNRPVAVKVMLASLSEDRKFVETFRREAQAAAALNHPNIAQVHSFGEEKGQLFMVMELLMGGRVDRMIAEGKPMDQALGLKIGIDVAEGLKAANEIGLIHGDIKPENILLDAGGVAKVVDFGLASFRDKAPLTEGVWGTPYYIAPEKARGQRADARSDIYSLGATLHHMLTGHPPFDGQTPLDVVRARLQRPPPTLSDALPGANRELEAILSRMLQPDPSMRYPTYASLIADMRKVYEAVPARPRLAIQSKKTTGKIVLTKAKGAAGSGGGARGERVVSAGDLGSYRKRLLGAADAPADQRSPKKTSRAFGVTLTIVLGLAVGGGGTFAYFQYRDWQARKAREATAAAALQSARQSARETFEAIRSTATSTLVRVSEIRVLATEATNALAEATAIWASSLALQGMTNTLPDLPALTLAVSNALDSAVSNAVVMDRLLGEAKTQAGEAEKTDTPEAAARMAAGMGVISSNVQTAAQAISQARGDVDAVRQEALAARRKMADAKEAAEAEAARLAAEKAEADRKAAEEAAAAKRAEEQKALVEKELALVKTAREAAGPLLRTQQPKEALAGFSAATGELKTDEGRQAAAAVTKRIALLQELRAFIIRQLAKEPYRWGWVTGGSSSDVLTADETNVVLRSRSVPWSEVSPLQMFRFVQHFVVSDAPVTRAEMARLCLAAAIFCDENGAAKQAGEFAQRATDLAPELKSAVKTLLPEASP